MTAFRITKEFIQHIKGALAVVILSSRSVVPHMVTTGRKRLIVHWGAAERGRRMVLIVAARMTTGVGRLTKGGRVSTDLTIVIIIARRSFRLRPVASVHGAMLIRRSNQHGVIRVSLDVLLQVLGSLEALAAEIALVWLQGHMNADMRCNVVALDRSRPALIPLTGQVQVVGALSTNVFLADMLIERLCCGELLIATTPAADERIISGGGTGLRGRSGRG
jgi:hypothetical protein